MQLRQQVSAVAHPFQYLLRKINIFVLIHLYSFVFHFKLVSVRPYVFVCLWSGLELACQRVH